MSELVGYNQVNKIAELVDQIMPDHINYVMLSFGTLVMYKPGVEIGHEVSSFEQWSLPEHRFDGEEGMEAVRAGNQTYLDSFLADSSRSSAEKAAYKWALTFLDRVGYPYPGGDRADRQAMELPLESLGEQGILYNVVWPSIKGIFKLCLG